MRTTDPADRTDAGVATPEIGTDAVLLLGEPVDGLGRGDLVLGELAGERVLVRRLPVDGDARTRAHATLLAERLVGLEHPHLLTLLDVRSDWSGLDLVYEAPSAVALSDVLQRRLLGPAEVVGLGRAVGQALARLHDAGLTHGRLGAADLLVQSDGSVLVTGYGVAGVLGSAGTAASDVADLVDLLLACLDPSAGPGGRLRQLLQPLVEAGRLETCRLEASQLEAIDLIDALAEMPSAPIGRRGPETSVRRPPRHRVRTRTLLQRLPWPERGWKVLGAVLPAALGVLLLAGWLGASLPSPTAEAGPGRPDAAGGPPAASTPAGPSPVPVPPRTTTASADWRAVLVGLNAVRGRLFAAPDERRLAEIDAPGSSAYASDRALIRELTRSGAASRGLQTDIVSVQARSIGPTHADLTVVDVLRPYTVVQAAGAQAGRVLQQRLGRPARTTRMVLVRVDGQWRVAEVRTA